MRIDSRLSLRSKLKDCIFQSHLSKVIRTPVLNRNTVIAQTHHILSDNNREHIGIGSEDGKRLGQLYDQFLSADSHPYDLVTHLIYSRSNYGRKLVSFGTHKGLDILCKEVRADLSVVICKYGRGRKNLETAHLPFIRGKLILPFLDPDCNLRKVMGERKLDASVCLLGHNT